MGIGKLFSLPIPIFRGKRYRRRRGVWRCGTVRVEDEANLPPGYGRGPPSTMKSAIPAAPPRRFARHVAARDISIATPSWYSGKGRWKPVKSWILCRREAAIVRQGPEGVYRVTVVETRSRREREKKARATGLSRGPRTTHLAHALGVPLLLTLGLGTLHRPPRARPSDWTDNSRRQPPSAPISSLSRPAFRGQSHRSGWVLTPARVCITICAVLDEENERDAHTHHPPSIQRPDRKARSKRSDSRSAQHHAHQHGARSSTSTVHGVLRAICYPALRGVGLVAHWKVVFRTRRHRCHHQCCALVQALACVWRTTLRNGKLNMGIYSSHPSLGDI